MKNKYFKYFIFIILFVVYLGYCLNTNCSQRQHDTRSFFSESDGHFGYIYYILENKKLPDNNLKQCWCFTNPPLFYVVSAIFVGFQNLVGKCDYQAIEGLQFLNMFFVLAFDFYVYKILDILNINKSKNYIILFIGLSPAIVYLSGSLNNDSLAILLSTISIFYTIRWYKKTEFISLVKIAFSIGLAVMTKINSGIVAIPIAVMFLIKVIKERDEISKYILYYFIFALIALPIGLWFPIKNLIKYNIPLTYVQTVVEGSENDGYIGYSGVLDRFFCANKEHLKTINMTIEKQKSDYNIFLTLLKSNIVDEQIEYNNNVVLKICVYIMFVLNLAMIILFFISIFENKKNVEMSFIYLIGLLEILFFIRFCFEYPYVFSMNIRYILPVFITIGISLGVLFETNERLFNIGKIFIEIFSIFSIILFSALI